MSDPPFVPTQGGCPSTLTGGPGQADEQALRPLRLEELSLLCKHRLKGKSWVLPGDQEAGASSVEEPPPCLPQKKPTLNSAGCFTEGSGRYPMAATVDEPEMWLYSTNIVPCPIQG